METTPLHEMEQAHEVRVPVTAPPATSAPRERFEESRTTTEVAAGGSMAEAIGGIAVIVLAIIGLANLFPVILTAVCSIVLGGALILQTAAMATRFARFAEEAQNANWMPAEIGGGLSMGFLGGAAGLVLGILGLVGVYPYVLLPVSAIVFGCAVLLGSGATWGMNAVTVDRWSRGNVAARHVASSLVSASTGLQLLAGLAAVILGIIGLVLQLPTLNLTLVAFLVLGASVFLSGAAVGSKMLTMLSRR